MDLRQLVSHLAEERNLDLRGYKTSTLERRFRHRMFQVKIGSFDAYARYIADHPDEVNQLLNVVLINVTKFFRDPQAWDFLRRTVVPALTAELKPGDAFRAWSAGCATGEETYSLAILLAEHFGADIRHYDVKVYGTDIDEEALNVARRGEYDAEKLEQVPPELRDKYFFTSGEHFRVQREVRRLGIFGRSNLALDAPISHVNLLLCRNVLIYFDGDLQRKILKRLHYALEPGGILMLGKAETQLAESQLFEVVHPKWRFFRRLPVDGDRRRRDLMLGEEDLLAKARNDYTLLKTLHESILETLEPGILVVDKAGNVISENEAAGKIWGTDGRLAGRKFSETKLATRFPEVRARLEAVTKIAEDTQRFEIEAQIDDEPRILAITLKAVQPPKGPRAGTLIYVEDVTPRQKLQHTIEELETTSEELQSTNEELETTNEELQSTNEELETTNEELQSTNEELETTNEELQALNEELGTTNEELEVRTRELDSVNERYSETLEHMPWPVLLVEENQVIQFWNSAAQRTFDLAPRAVIGLQLAQLPLQHKFREALLRRYRETLVHRRPRIYHKVVVDTNHFRGLADLHFTPLDKGRKEESVLIVIEPLLEPAAAAAKPAKRTNRNKRPAKAAKRSSRKRATRKKKR